MTNTTHDVHRANNKKEYKALGSTLIVSLIAKLTTIPVFILLYRFLPPLNWPFYLDKIFLYLLVFIFFEWLLIRLKKIIIPSAAILFILLTIGTFTNRYSHQTLITDYKALFYNALYTPIPNALDIKQLNPFPNERAFRKAINYNSPIVRQFAIQAVNKHFRNQQQGPNRNLVQGFAVFKEIKSRWNYINDPKSREYYARASESAILLGGDCDDYSILMAACLQSIGCISRLTLTTQHVYPEILIGNKHDLERMTLLIGQNLFSTENKQKPLHYHIDADGKIWLNLDYTASYPGGPFMAEPVLGILYL
jgi:hypothetical protein